MGADDEREGGLKLELRASADHYSSRRASAAGLAHRSARPRRRIGLFKILCILWVASVPLDSLPIFGGRSATLFISLPMIAIYLGSSRVRRVDNSNVLVSTQVAKVAMVVVGSVGAITIFWAMDPDAAISKALSLMGLILAAFALQCGLRGLSLVPIWSYCLAALVPASIVLISTGQSDEAYRVGALNQNYNVLAFVLIVAVAGTLHLLFSVPGATRRLLSSVMLVVFVVASLKTGSRTGAIALASIPAVLLVVSLIHGSIRTRLLGAVAAMASLAVVWWVFVTRPVFVPERVWNTADALQNGSFDRLTYWSFALSDLQTWWFSGVGLGSSLLYMTDTFNTYQTLHDTPISVLVEGGILLGVPFAVMVVASSLSGLRSEYRAFLLLAAVPVLLFLSTSTLETNKVIWMLIALSLVPAGSAVSSRRSGHEPLGDDVPTKLAAPGSRHGTRDARVAWS